MVARRCRCRCRYQWLLTSALVGSMAACGGGDTKRETPETGVAGNTRPSGNGACGLMMQSEVDELFGTSVGAGAAESLDGGDIEICTWPAGEDPALLLQISPASDDIRQAVDLGEGFRVADVAGMSGRAAAALEQADGDQAVAVIAMTSGERTITVSPIGLGMLEGTPSFEKLKAIVDEIASRLESSGS